MPARIASTTLDGEGKIRPRSTLTLITPTPPQKRIAESPCRFNIAAWGRQSGKTTYGINKVIKGGWEGPRDSVYWYILQTHDAAKVAYRRAKEKLHSAGALRRKPNDSELWLPLLKPGVDIFFKSGQVLDNLRVETLRGVVIDEYRQQHPELWPMVIRPMLGRFKGWADILSTTNGYDHFKDLWDMAESDPDWGRFHASSAEAPWWTVDEIESARRTMSEPEFAQEIMAEFRDLKRGRAYHAYTAGTHQRDSCPFTPNGDISKHLPIIVAPDFNLNPMAWGLGQQKIDDFYWFDEINLPNSHTQEAAFALVAKVKDHGPGVIICGDATAKAGQRAAAGKSDYDILCGVLNMHNVKWTNATPESNPTVKDRVNTVNSKFRNAAGEVHMWHHSRCKAMRKDWERVTWKETSDYVLDPGTKKDLTHASDGPGYAVCAMSPLPSTEVVGKLRIIER